MNKEEWKPICGYEGLYEISNFGRLKSYHNKKYPEGKVLSVKNSTGWYLSVALIKDKSRKTSRIHVLVAETFIGNIPKGYHVHHKDGNKQNNVVWNLEIIPTKEHALKTIAMNPDFTNGMNKYNKYERPKRIQQYTMDGFFIAEYVNGAIAEKFTGVCQRNILQVATQAEYKPGKVRKQAGGYIWKFKEESEVM